MAAITGSGNRSNRGPPVVVPSSSNNIIINPVQRGNPVIECIKNVGKEFGDIVADYQVGKTTGVLFLSLRYHRLHPEYITTRIDKLGRSYDLRILLIHCDTPEHKGPIRELTKLCLLNNITVLVAFSQDEAGHYLSTLKRFEHKSPDLIKERVDKDYYAMLQNSLTGIDKINKTNAETLRTNFGSFAKIASATPQQLQNLPGFGQVKVKSLRNAFDKPFRNQATSAVSSQPPMRSQPATAEAPGSSSLPRPEPSSSARPPPAPRPREPSPMWDIEFNDDLPDDSTTGAPRRKATPEPFPIDLDLT